jgi:hypothetical protein
MDKEYRDQNVLWAEVELSSQKKGEQHVAHEFVRLRACSPDSFGTDPFCDAEKDRTGGYGARDNEGASKMRPNR